MKIHPVSKIIPTQRHPKKSTQGNKQKSNKPKDTSFEGILLSIQNSKDRV